MTSADFASRRDNFCYRHPQVQSFVLCQRCLRTVCADCQTQAAVGVICPECVKAQRKAESPAQRRARRQWGASALSGKPPVVTTAIIAVTAFVGLLQLIPGFGTTVTGALMFYAPAMFMQPWRLLSALLVHGGMLHFALNMLALYLLGRSLEPALGRWRFLALYLISGLGGSVAVALIAPWVPVVGASGAIFGLFGAILVFGKIAGANLTGILVILGVNLVIGFIPGFHIAWQAHIGGAVVGALIGLIYAKTRSRQKRGMQIALLIALTLALLVIAWVLPPLLH